MLISILGNGHVLIAEAVVRDVCGQRLISETFSGCVCIVLILISMNQSNLQHNLLDLSEEASELYLPKTVQKLTTAPTPLKFLRQYVMPNIPVVVENGVSHWPALQKWNDKYLNSVLGKKISK